MAMLEIKKYGDSILRKKAVSVEQMSGYIKNLAQDMLDTMYCASGVGLAAPQIGVSLRLCVIDVDPDKKSPIVMINPKTINTENKIESEEGCLSFPGLSEKIKRFEKIEIEYTDLNGKKYNLKFEGLLAKAAQHEIDHLDAKLFIDYLPEWKRKLLEKEIKRKKKIGKW